MQDAIETLVAEHRLIKSVLRALDAYVAAVSADGEYDSGDLEQFIQFIRQYADAAHHAKEEDILFTAMVDNGFPREAGPIAVMLHEHDVGRGLVSEMAAVLELGAPWDAQAKKRLVAAATEFADMLRMHIQKEDEVLYPMAQGRLPDSVYSSVCERCSARQRELESGGRNAALVASAEALIERYS